MEKNSHVMVRPMTHALVCSGVSWIEAKTALHGERGLTALAPTGSAGGAKAALAFAGVTAYEPVPVAIDGNHPTGFVERSPG